MEGRLHKKSIVIIGGTGGLGLSAAHACAAEGANLVLVGRDETRLATALQDVAGARGIVGDAMESSTAERAIQEAVQHFGKLDGLYHVAGGSGRRLGDGPLHEITDEGWQYTIDLNLRSLFYANRAAIRQLLEQGNGGSVVNMSSVLADSPSPKYFATHTYAATKAGAIGLTRAAAAYYAPQSIRFNAVAPALFATPLASRALGDPAIMDYVASKQPLDGGRAGHPQDLDEAVVFLLSDAARFMTGQVLQIDGGWSVTEGQHPTPPVRLQTDNS
ncbi:MAG TPA: short-chain dehydrogenase [Planctomycetaceae bacterium]|nr:short-chain dehydrogenase [Blastopirellula sp.]HAY80221.1 short-chain dehydrogenase [Planctomycetaceae bacterium]